MLDKLHSLKLHNRHAQLEKHPALQHSTGRRYVMFKKVERLKRLCMGYLTNVL